jgi:hypothetical protein
MKFNLTGYWNYWTNESEPTHVELRAVVDTLEAAQQYVASKPKVLGLKATTLSTTDEHGTRVTKGYVSASVKLQSDRANGGRNEAGVKRVQRWVNELPIEYSDNRCSNAYGTLDELLAAI